MAEPKREFMEEVNKLNDDLLRLFLKLQDLDGEEKYTEQQRAYFEDLANRMEDLYRRVHDDIRYDRLPKEELEALKKKAEEKEVRCIDCKHLHVDLIMQRNLSDRVCCAPVWKELGKSPHVVRHDLYKPILCDHFEKKGGTDR